MIEGTATVPEVPIAKPSRRDAVLMKCVAAYEMAGGVTGIMWCVRAADSTWTSRAGKPIGQVISMLLLGVLVAVFALSAVAGWQLWRQTKVGYRWSSLSLTFQLPALDVFGVRYQVVMLWGAFFGVEWPRMGWWFLDGSQANLLFHSGASPLAIKVNLVALGLLAMVMYQLEGARGVSEGAPQTNG